MEPTEIKIIIVCHSEKIFSKGVCINLINTANPIVQTLSGTMVPGDIKSWSDASASRVGQLADDPSKLTLGGEMREMTLLFADIRGFTTISEQFDAEGLTQITEFTQSRKKKRKSRKGKKKRKTRRKKKSRRRRR